MLAAVAPAGAAASMRQESIMEDPAQLLQAGPERQAAVLDEMRGLGVDTVRSQVTWRNFVADPDAAKRPAGGAAPEQFDVLDDLVRGAHARGMRVLLTPSSPIPRWASGCHGSAAKVQACKPDPALFGAFVRALGQRYSGHHRDENQGGGVLPRVDRWGLWNEPNLSRWLSPQYSKAGVPVSAEMYRALARSAIAGLRASGHGSDTILLGETAPVGRMTGPLAIRAAPPVDFLRALFCVGATGHRLRGAAAGALGCRRVRRLRVSAISHHPYTQGAHSAPFSPEAPGQISFTSVGRLKTVMRQGARSGAIRAHLPIWWTEFGYQSNPPDRVLGVPLKAQATYLNLADFLAASDPRIHAVSQYQLVDDQLQESFQTGLRRFGSLARKPAWFAYALPIWVQRRGARVHVYGQLRAAPARSRQTVVLQRSPAPGKAFATVDTFRVRGATHQFVHTTAYAPGVWRLKWMGIESRAALPYAKP